MRITYIEKKTLVNEIPQYNTFILEIQNKLVNQGVYM